MKVKGPATEVWPLMGVGFGDPRGCRLKGIEAFTTVAVSAVHGANRSHDTCFQGPKTCVEGFEKPEHGLRREPNLFRSCLLFDPGHAGKPERREVKQAGNRPLAQGFDEGRGLGRVSG